MRKRSAMRALLATTAAVAVAAMLGGAAFAAPTVTTVASGLDNPRDLAFGPGGKLYVAEAGHGGPECLAGGGEGGDLCVGFTSQISRIDQGSGTVTPVVTGLVSTAGSDGSGATGIDGISVQGNGGLF